MFDLLFWIVTQAERATDPVSLLAQPPFTFTALGQLWRVARCLKQCYKFYFLTAGYLFTCIYEDPRIDK